MAHVIAAGALLRGNRVLLGHRSAARRDFPGRWSLPGGHVEPGEAPADALVREMQEELGVEATVPAAPSMRLERRPERDDGMVQDVWVVTAWGGDVTNRAEDEHDELRWVTAEELPHLDLAHPEHLPFLLGLLARQPQP